MSTTLSPRVTRPRKQKRSFSTVTQPRRSVVMTIAMCLVLIYALLPLVWLVVNSTKTQAGLFASPGLWFDKDFALWTNIHDVLTYQDSIFLRWLGNTLLYVIVGAGGATLLATLGGYGLAKFKFPGRPAVLAIVLGAVAVPGTALAVPTFLMFSKMGLTNTPWAVIIPSLISPFGLYLMWVFVQDSIPNELLEAARVDGAGELRIFLRIVLPLLGPGLVTVLLFTMVATWNNYFLPLIMLKDPPGIRWSSDSTSGMPRPPRPAVRPSSTWSSPVRC